MMKNGIKILLISLFTVMLLPLVIATIGSFSKVWHWTGIFPMEYSLQVWKETFGDKTIYTSIFNSVVISIAVTIVNILLAVPAGDFLGRIESKWNSFFTVILILPLLIPPYVFSMGNYYFFIKWGLTDNILGVVLAHIPPTFPYMLISLRAAFSTLSFDMENQARLLGAGRINIYRYIIIPHLFPALIAGSTLSILVSVSQYLTSLIVGGGIIITIPIVFIPYINGGVKSIAFVMTVLFFSVNLLMILLIEKGLKKYYLKKRE